MSKELQLQQQRCSDLEAEIARLRQNEQDINSRTDDAGLEPEIIALREQLQKEKQDLDAARETVHQAERLHDEQREKAAMYRVSQTNVRSLLHTNSSQELYEKCRSIWTTVYQERIQLDKVERADSVHRLCLPVKHVEDIARELEALFDGEQANKFNRLHEEHDAREQELIATKSEVDTLRALNQELDAELATIRQQKAELEANVENAQRTNRSCSNDNALATSANKAPQFHQECHSKTQDYATMEHAYKEMANRASELQNIHDLLQTQVAQNLVKIDGLSKEANGTQLKAETAVRLAQASVTTVEQESHDMAIRLEQSRREITTMKEANIKEAYERDTLRQQLGELQAASRTQEAELLRVRAEAAESRQALIDNQNAATSDANQDQARLESASNEAQATIRRSKDEHQGQLELHKKLMEGKMQQLNADWERKLKEMMAQKDLSIQKATQSHKDGTAPDAPYGAKKRVNRLSHTAPNSMNSPETPRLSSMSVAAAQLPSTRTERETSELSSNLFEEHVEAEDFLVETERLVINPFPELVPDTQGHEGLSMSIENFDERMGQATQRVMIRSDTSSSEMSSMSSESMMQLGKEAERTPAQLLCGQEHSTKQRTPASWSEQAGHGSENKRESNRQALGSNERPRSQANTASRLMPPPTGQASLHVASSARTQKAAKSSPFQSPTSDRLGQGREGDSGKSSPCSDDFSSSSNPRQGNDRREHRMVDRGREEQKRKGSGDSLSKSVITKKRRAFSEYETTSDPSIPGHDVPSLTQPRSSDKGSELNTDHHTDPYPGASGHGSQSRSTSTRTDRSNQERKARTDRQSQGPQFSPFLNQGVASARRSSSRLPKSRGM